MKRIFDNPQKLHIKIVEKRLFPLDKNALASVSTFDDKLSGNKHDYVEVDSVTLTDQQIVNALAAVTSSAEQTYLNDFDADRVQLRNEWETMYNQLITVANGTGQMNTNEMTANIRYNAKVLALMLRLFTKQKLLED